MRNRVISGLLVIVPLGITIFVLRLFYGFTAGHLTSPLRKIFGDANDYVIAAISVFFFFFVLYVTGMAAAAVVGKRLIALAEAIIERIPLVKTIYGASKQVVEAISLQDATNFKSVVFIEFPRPGIMAMGFSTGTVTMNGENNVYYKVFIPTTPNPTSGYLEIVPASEVYFSSMTIDEALSFVVSGGIVSPPALDITAAGNSSSISPVKSNEEEDGEEDELDAPPRRMLS